METAHNLISLCALFNIGVDATCVLRAVNYLPCDSLGPRNNSSTHQWTDLGSTLSRSHSTGGNKLRSNARSNLMSLAAGSAPDPLAAHCPAGCPAPAPLDRRDNDLRAGNTKQPPPPPPPGPQCSLGAVSWWGRCQMRGCGGSEGWDQTSTTPA